METLNQIPPFWLGVLGAVVAGFFGTAIGGVPVVAVRALPARTGNALLSFAAGVMLAATFFGSSTSQMELTSFGSGAPTR